ncbi:MAG TPA: hypothetical protein VIL97_04590 [Thermoanaerobaculia bacterium]
MQIVTPAESIVNPLPDSISRARKTAEHAIEIDPASQMGWEFLADACYFARDLPAFRSAADRTITLNPLNASALALLAMRIAYSGEWERGMALMQEAMELNSQHPGWYHFVAFHDHYRKSEYEESLEAAKRINMPESLWTHAVTAACCGRLGRRDEGRVALENLKRFFPDYPDGVRAVMDRWVLDSNVVDLLMEGLVAAEELTAPTHKVGP